jgi:subtilisin family serine protease
MREQRVTCFIEQHRSGDRPGRGDDDSAPGLISLPSELLQRHGAKMLRPEDAVAIEGWPDPQSAVTPRSTVYRARTLLVAGDVLSEPTVGPINEVLAGVGMSLGPAAASGRPAQGVLRRLPRLAVLQPAPPAGGAAQRPVVVDAWVALQTLRAAALASEHPMLDKQTVSRIGLEHLLIGAAITGSPAGGWGGAVPAGPGGGSGLTGPSSTDSYVYCGGDTRAPVAVTLDAPARRTAAECADACGRRPVVAVLDTGSRAHRWLDVWAKPAGGYDTGADGFVTVDQGIQDVIYADSQQAAQSGDRPRQLIEGPWDTPITADPLIGELNECTGHGTFIAGIMRQVVPDAQVLALRIMHGDGVVYESDLICALGLLAERVAAAVDDDLGGMVDVVSLSLGYFDESAADVTFSSGLWQAIDTLLEMGVEVVAAAGNYSTSRRFYPAAFTEEPAAAGRLPIFAVGALNPNGSKALFSDGGRWINAWASGASVVSTFPEDINGSRSPEIRMRAHPANELPPGISLPAEREALDADDYSGGFAVWSGTSFSAPLLAAHIARELAEGAAADPALRLDQPGTPAAVQRATQALAKLGWPG